MPFDSFDWIFDPIVENMRIRAEREKARALQQEIQLREKLDFFSNGVDTMVFTSMVRLTIL